MIDQFPAWRRPFWTPERIKMFGQPLANASTVSHSAPPLIIGLVANYSADQLAPFIFSLKAIGYSGEVVFLVNNLSSETLAFLKQHAIGIVPFEPHRFAPYHIHNSRFFLYLEYFLTRLMKDSLPRAVLFTDVRDVIFQGDPFSEPANVLDVFYESERPKIGQCPINSRWIRNCFGELLLQEVAESTISCAGTIMTDGVGAIRYLIEMFNILILLPKHALNWGSDQAVHNLIVHRGLIDGMKAHANGERVLTLNNVKSEEIRLAPNGQITGANGYPSPIVHQYDRHPVLANDVANRFRIAS